MPPDPQPQATSTTGAPSWMAPVMLVVPDHELLRRIGGGSYGDVWLARTTVGTWRAVKVVFRDRFTDARPYEREFNGIQKFEPLSRSNEGFIDILQIGRNDAEGYFYYVMELADDANADVGGTDIGGTSSASPHLASPQSTSPSPKLESGTRVTRPSETFPHFDASTYVPKTLSKVLLQRGRLPLGECLELGLTLNLGLAHLHRAGLIHRDIKPSNLIFVGGVPKLADIGLVIETAEARSYVGTEGFIPPEGPNSSQADLYSLGKVLYEAGMGKDRKDFPELFTQIIDAPDSAQLLEFNAILLKACAANVKERYQSAEDMNADLALLQSGGSVRRQRKLAGQLRFVQRAGALVTAFAAVIAFGWWWQSRQTAQVRQLVAEKSRVITEKTELAGALTRAGEQDRDRLVRLSIANGNRLLEEGDSAGALVWFAESLPLLTNNPAAETIHRIRIDQTLALVPRVLQVLPHESGVVAAVYSPDGRRVATGTRDGNLRVWDLTQGTVVWGPKPVGAVPAFVRFSRDGRRLLVSSSAQQGLYNRELPNFHVTAVLDADTGTNLFATSPVWAALATNQLGSAFSPDDRWVAVAQPDHVIRVFSVTDGQPLRELRGHTNTVQALSFSADSGLLVSASQDRTVRVWRLPSGEPHSAPFEHRWPVVRAALSADHRRLVTACFEPPPHGSAEVLVWDLERHQRIGNALAVRDDISVFLPPASSDRFFVQDREEFQLRAYGLRTGGPLSGCPEMNGTISWDFSRDGSRVALGSGDHVAQVFDFRTGSPLLPPFRHSQWGISAVQFSPDEDHLLTACADGNVRIWDLTPPERDTFHQPMGEGFSLTESLIGELNRGKSPVGIPVLLSGGSISVVNDQLEEVARFRAGAPESTLILAHSSPDGRTWYIPEFAGKDVPGQTLITRLWRLEAGGPRAIELPHPQGFTGFDFSSDSTRFVTLGLDRVIRVWRSDDGQLEKAVETPELRGGSLADVSAPSGTGLWQLDASGDAPDRCRYRFFNLASGKPIGDVFELAGPDFFSDFAPDGRRLALWGVEGLVHVVEVPTGRLLSSSIRHPLSLRWAQWNPDGRRLLTVGGNDEVLIWEADTGREALPPLRTAGNRIARACWSADGRFVVTVSRGPRNPVIVWDAVTGDRVTPPLEHRHYVRFAAVTPGQFLVTGTWADLPLRSWALRASPQPAEFLLDYARFLAGRQRGSGGELQAVPPGELAALGRSLRARHPELFTVTRDDLVRRFRRETERVTDLGQLERGLWQLDRFARLSPNDPEVQQLRHRLETLRAPTRATATPTNLIDLTDFYTWSLDMARNQEFAELPRGIQDLAGTQWDLRGVAVVGAGESLSGIPVQQQCARLHFLQFVGGDRGRDGGQVAHWVVHYVDGTVVEWPLIYGEHLRDWWWASGQPREARQAEIAWEGHPPIHPKGVRLFKSTWTNPRPEVAIKELSLVGGEVNAYTSVVAITAE